MQLRTQLFNLLTYVIFWRVGDNLAEEKWRLDYEEEVKWLFKLIDYSFHDLSEGL